MKISILCNFGPYFSVGGSEAVIREISERLTINYGYKVSIYAYNYKKASTYNGINLFPCPKGDKLISTLAYNDHIFVYSDSFWGFDTLLQNADKINSKVSVGLVGAYHLQSYPKSLKLLEGNIEKFNLIVHSNITPDYKWCFDKGLPVTVIPNGVTLSEFSNNSINFREKYHIKEKYIILSISNYFFGKGFELLPEIMQELSKKVEEMSEDMGDFVLVQLSNTVEYPYDKLFLERTKRQSKGLNIRFLRDIPREDVVAAFSSSDVFLFPSKKEVAPIVILECRAAKLPYVAMRVGNVSENPGGIPLNYENVDKKGYVVVGDHDVKHFSAALYNLLKPCGKLRSAVIDEGQKGIERIDWDNIIPLYDKEFKK